MYLSRIALDEEMRETTQLLSSPHFIHGAVERSFDGMKERNLWRIDRLKGMLYLLVLSKKEPNFEHIFKKHGIKNSDPKWETVDYSLLLNRIEVGQEWSFRLCANPVVGSMAEKNNVLRRGKIYAHVTHEQQKKWLIERAKKNGFLLQNEKFDVVETNWRIFKKDHHIKNMVKIKTVTFEGELIIEDIGLFINALRNGIGKAKAYGCGLITIAKPKKHEQ